MVEDVLRKVVDEVGAGRPVALCAIVAARGSTPQPAGTMVCVDHAAQMTGTLGGGCVEADVRRKAHQCLSEKVSRIVTFALDHDFGYDDGMLCGGQMDVALAVYSRTEDTVAVADALRQLECGFPAEIPLRLAGDAGNVEYCIRIAATPKLVIVGGGHIGRILAQMSVPLGFRVTVLDDRQQFANPDRFPPPITPVAGDIAGVLKEWLIDADTYLVIVTRGHKHDEAALRSVIGSPARYIGMIGSRRKIRVIFDDLKHDGATDAQIARVHAPIGLEIGAVTAEEIALSIAAELVSVRRAECGPKVTGPTYSSRAEP
ncbi:MAG: XdhC family protein [Planctomycetota bacterium]